VMCVHHRIPSGRFTLATDGKQRQEVIIALPTQLGLGGVDELTHPID